MKVHFNGNVLLGVFLALSILSVLGMYSYKKNNEGNRRGATVGFDMKGGDKLFGVVQQLHKMQELEETGVGLTLVHRVVSRHGARSRLHILVNGQPFSFHTYTKLKLIW